MRLNGGNAALLTLNPATGALAVVGALPDYSDALAFSPTAIPEPSTWPAIFGAAALGVAIVRRRKSA